VGSSKLRAPRKSKPPPKDDSWRGSDIRSECKIVQIDPRINRRPAPFSHLETHLTAAQSSHGCLRAALRRALQARLRCRRQLLPFQPNPTMVLSLRFFSSAGLETASAMDLARIVWILLNSGVLRALVLLALVLNREDGITGHRRFDRIGKDSFLAGL